MEIYMLDMGRKRYGDCILITRNNKTILIDGAHPNDENLLIPQFRKIFNQSPPFNIDLLIVTHCHGDHIGCLPGLIERGALKINTALVADENMGWGRDVSGNSPIDAAQADNEKMLLAALLEEDHSDLADAELLEFLEDALGLEEKYVGMLKTLEEEGVTIYRFGREDISDIENDFADFGLKILGPTQDHLIKCADLIARGTTDALDSLRSDFASDSIDDIASTYKNMTKLVMAKDSAEPGEDQPGAGAARNNQSIVVSVEADGWKALLAGDMQFAKAEVSGLNAEMEELRQVVLTNGPYDFVKLTHHTSYNAVNEDLLDEWSDTTLFAHTGGSNDSRHPEENVLEILKARARTTDLQFARTDRNGIIKIVNDDGIKMIPSKGRLNDFTPNVRDDEFEELVAPEVVVPTPETSSTHATLESLSTDTVEIRARIPHKKTEVKLTIAITPATSTDIANHSQPTGIIGAKKDLNRKSDSRDLAHLLFITSSPRLRQNIGVAETSQVFDYISRSLNGNILDIPTSASSAAQASSLVRKELQSGNYKGVVILGGYDVVPPNRVSAIDARLRREIVEMGNDRRDADDFIVWNDDVYGDTDDDVLPELPVSRIPDGRTGKLILSALKSPAPEINSRFGVRNIARPFAHTIFDLLPGTNKLGVSQTFSPTSIKQNAAKGAVYYMLHGSDRDATQFWGEDDERSIFDAVDITNVPDSCPGTVVFTGCCWGALIAYPPAVRMVPANQLRPRLPESSIALKYLAGGGNAFVGCTGSHYSPVVPPLNYYGAPLHEKFWKKVLQGQAPAQALYESRIEYAGSIPHGRADAYSQAIELKIFNQFTCLGLGW